MALSPSHHVVLTPHRVSKGRFMSIEILAACASAALLFSALCLYLMPGVGKPGRLKRTIAFTWFLIRRTTGTIGTVFFLSGSFHFFNTAFHGHEMLANTLVGLFLLSLAIFLLHFTFFGKKSRTSTFPEDRAVYHQRKEGYRKE
ncbi:hypothetical protein HPT27_06360 [Permianibacter sp. IMCC34836]|uniref:hypothetical protein n=1 Tax=Permianibacter fluminis TaxID=2738515 RepID=UPI0015539A69|nr:hypothetical protein [Permianibacter fluminis]NQD36641.1 hypothetical protein [Permianibacter fluminis]